MNAERNDALDGADLESIGDDRGSARREDGDHPEDGVRSTESILEETAAPAATLQQIRRERMRLLLRSPGFIIGVLILIFWVIAAIAPSFLATEWGPKDTVRNAEGTALSQEGPGGDAWFGTDRLARDVYSRVIHGARPILIAAPLATAMAIVVGTLLGLFTGFYQGWIDEIISRILEAVLSIPVILLAIVIVFTFGATDPVVIGSIAFLFVPPIARTVRATTLAEARLDYVTSAKMRGESSLFIITREILPNITGVIVVEATVRLAYAVFTLATLAFLGLTGGNATDADWGVDVAQNYEDISTVQVWWPTIFPALAIASLVIAVNLIADSVDEVNSS